METLARSANRGSVSTGGYDIDNSLKLEKNNSEYLYRTFSSGNSKTWTWSGWVKRTLLVGDTDGGTLFDSHFNLTRYFFIHFYQDKIQIYNYNGGIDYGKVTRQVFRDMSAWYHVVLAMDTTQATEADRMKLYINGTQITEFETDHGNFPLNYDTEVNKAQNHYIGYRPDSTLYSSQYMSEINFVDGQQLAPTEFGEVDSDSGIWKAKAYTGTYGTNGFYTKFDNSSDLGEDATGGTSFTLNNITSADQATDTPTNNFCVYNPVADFRQRDLTGFKNGGTQITHTDEGQWCGGVCTMGVTRGKWYWEIQQYDTDDILFGVHTFTGYTGGNTNPHNVDNCWYYYGGGGSGSYWGRYINGTGFSNSANRGTVWSAGNIIGFALNLDDDEFTFYVNGGSAGASNTNVDISSLTALGLPLIPFIGMWRSSVNLNFGGFTMTSISSGNTDANGYGNFEYAPPTGYYAICTKNLAEFG